MAGQLLRWNAASDALLVWVRQDGAHWAEGDLAKASTDGELTLIPRGDLAPLRPGGDIDHLSGVKADWMGDTPVLYARPGDGVRFDWYALPGGEAPRAMTAGLSAAPSRLSAVHDDGLLMFADGGLWEAGAGRLRRLSPQRATVSEALRPDRMIPVRLRVNTPPRRDWALGLGTGGDLAAIDSAGRFQRLGPMDMSAETLVVGAGKDVVVTLARDHGVETLAVVAAGARHNLAQVNETFRDLAMAHPVAVPHLNAAGQPATSQLFLPPDPERRIRGVIVLAYPGWTDAGRYITPETILYGPRAAMLAAEGYAVLSPDVPVSAQGSGTIEDFEAGIDLAVDALFAAYPALPADRLALMGHSFGGYTTLAISTRSTRYRSFIAWAAASDMFSAWGEFTPQNRAAPEDGFTLQQRMGWVESNQGGLPGPPWKAVQAYVDASPFVRADELKAPLLMIGADMDVVVLSQAEQMFSAINRSGGRARLISYWGEGHFNFSPANIVDVYAQITRWLDETWSVTVSDARAEGGLPNAGPRPPSPLQSSAFRSCSAR